MDVLSTLAERLLGIGADHLTWYHLALRALLIYAGGLGLVRLGKRRFMGQYSAFDMILGVTVGALLSTAAADADVFVNALALVAFLGVLHWISAFASFHWKSVEDVLKGRAYHLIEDGKPVEGGLHRAFLSQSDLEQAMRKAGQRSLLDVEHAHLERSGEVSIIAARRDGARRAEVVEVDVREGVQRVVIELRSDGAVG